MSLSCPTTGVKPNGVWAYRWTGRPRNGVRSRSYTAARLRALRVEGLDLVEQKDMVTSSGSAKADPPVIELAYAHNKVQDVEELHSTAERQLTELLDLFGKAKRRKRSPKSAAIRNTPVNVHKKLEWGEEEKKEGVFVKTSREEEDPEDRRNALTPPPDERYKFAHPALLPTLRHKSGPLLTADEEKELAFLVQRALQIDDLKRSFCIVFKRAATWSELAMIFKTDEVSLKQEHHVGHQAKMTMLERNMRLVFSMALRYRPRGISLWDMVADGSAGLLRAIEKFDPEKGFKLSTYAHWWIKQGMKRALSERKRLVKVPTNVTDEFRKILRAKERHIEEKREMPSDVELAKQLGLTEKRFEAIMNAYWRSVSMEAPLSFADRNSGNRGDMIEDTQSESPDDFFTRNMLRHDLELVLRTLPEKEATILRLRYGLEDGNERTLEDIGLLFHITRERVRQIEVKALRKLRYRSESLEEYLEQPEPLLYRTRSSATLKTT